MKPQSIVGYHFQHFLFWSLIGWSLIGLVLYLSLTSNLPEITGFPSVDKIEHVLAYSVLMGWFCQLYTSKRRQLILAVMFCLMGISLEFIQGWGGQRYFAYADMAANTVGVLLGWWLSQGWCAGWLHRVDQALFRQ